MSKNIQVRQNIPKQFSLVAYLRSPNAIRDAVTVHAVLLFCIHITMQLAMDKKPAAVAEIRDPLQVFSNFQVVMKQTLSLVPPAIRNKIPQVPNMWTPPQETQQGMMQAVVYKQMMETFMSYSSLMHGSFYYQAASTFAAEYTKSEHLSEIYRFCVLMITSMWSDMKRHEQTNKGQGKPPMFKWFSNFMALRAPKVPNRELIYAILHFIGLIVSITFTWTLVMKPGGISQFEYFYRYFTYLAIFRMFMGTFKARVLKRNRNNRHRFEEINNRKNRNQNNRQKRLRITNGRNGNGRNNRALVIKR